jgi:hypothetical protein
MSATKVPYHYNSQAILQLFRESYIPNLDDSKI